MRRRTPFLIGILLLTPIIVFAQTDVPYRQPSKDIVAMLDATRFPQSQVSPDGRWLLLMEQPAMPTIADLSQPMLRLAGTRISPRTNGAFNHQGFTRLTIVDPASKGSREISLPPNPRLDYVSWSPDSRKIAFVHRAADGLELWVAEVGSGKSTRIISGVNSTTRNPFAWLPDSNRLICLSVPAGRGPEPKPADVPLGPKIQATKGGASAPTATYQDLLQNPRDEALFKYYFTSQLKLVDSSNGRAEPIGSPAIFDETNVSPDGKYIFVSRVVQPFSYYVPYFGFAKELEVWSMSGAVAHKVASLPLAEKTPIGGVRTGPRSVRWQPNQPATLIYAEALDEGNPKAKVEKRDRVMQLEAPFSAEPRELFKSEFRFADIQWTEGGDYALWREMDRPTRKTRTYLIDVNHPESKPRLVFDRLTEDRYNNPGSLVVRANSKGEKVAQQSTNGQYIYLTGQGATPQGERPFLRRLNLATLQTEELFRSQDPYYESVEAVLDRDATRIITTRESSTEPPNFLVRDLSRKSDQTLTHFTDPQPAFRKLKKQLVTYKRADGVTLSGTLYLPPDYKQGERRPTFIWAYPNEFASADAASQVSGSPNRFTRVSGASHLFLALEGYVVLDNAAMPILGGDKANDTFVEQLVENAQAAIDYLVGAGVTDRDRVGVGGHSYGAFMTANLLAHSDLFRAGIARSGAYNRTLTPFSFQNEQRTFWESPDVYIRISPFMVAHKINEPILLIHGQADNNSGTFPIQSERLFHALRGLGKTARFVELPFEAHGYAARESILHSLYEMINWMDQYVKNVPRQSQAVK
jgi:dipeptidyl aminopeptidase/acylaminoacyl peptidase